MRTIRPTSVIAFTFLTCAGLAGCSHNAAPQEEQSAEVLTESADDALVSTQTLLPAQCGGITRLHVLGDIYLGSQPKAEDFAQARKDGIRTVINLRHAAELTDFNEQQVVEAEGLAYVNIPWSGANELTDAIFDSARAQFTSAPRPMLVHCASANRVGAVWIPYRVLDAGVTWDAALVEAKTIGLKSPEFEAKALDYIQRHEK